MQSGLSVCRSVCHDREPYEKRLNRSRCRSGYGLGLAKKSCVRWGADWRNLASTIEPSMCTAAMRSFLSNYVDYLLMFLIETHFITNCNVCYFHFWATDCKKRFALCYRTVVLSVCLSVLSVTLVYCDQTVGWIKIKLGIVVGLSRGHIVLAGDPGPSSPSPKGQSPQFSVDVFCGQTAAHLSYC